MNERKGTRAEKESKTTFWIPFNLETVDKKSNLAECQLLN